jgi:lipopolysaccharide assembly protein A
VKYLLWIFRILVFVILLGFALKNTDPVAVQFWLGMQWEAPVVFVLLAAFVLGAIGGVLASLGVIFRRRREIASLRKQLRAVDKGKTG